MTRAEAIQILGTSTDVQKAFRRLAMVHHPDHGGDPEDFQRIIEARDLLLNEPANGHWSKLYEESVKGPSEAKFTAFFKKVIVDAGGVCYKIHGHAMQTGGLPDFYFALRSIDGWAELKVGKNSPTDLQTKRLQDLTSRGVFAVWVREEGDVAIYSWEGRELARGRLTPMLLVSAKSELLDRRKIRVGPFLCPAIGARLHNGVKEDVVTEVTLTDTLRVRLAESGIFTLAELGQHWKYVSGVTS